MNFTMITNTYLKSYGINFLLYLLLSGLFIKLILERRTYLSSDKNKMIIFGAISFAMAFIINYIMVLIYGVKIIAMGMNFLYVIPTTLMYFNFILFSIISFEFLYDFFYLKTKLKFNNIYPYLILYGYLIITPYFSFNMPSLSYLLSIASIFYFLYLLKVIMGKGSVGSI